MIQFWWGEATDEPGWCGQSAPASRGRSPHRECTSYWWGEATDEPSCELFSAPNQIEHPAFERPVLDPFDQSFANGIFLHVNPLFRIIFAIAQPMMPAARLKFPFPRGGFRWGERPREPFLLQGEFPFPIGNPCFNGEVPIPWRTK